MISLRADNRSLTKNSKSSYLTDNYVSGVSEIVVVNINSFSTNDYIVLGEFGSETTEIVQISYLVSDSSPSYSPSASYSPSVSASPSASPSEDEEIVIDNNTIYLKTPTKFAHPQDTKVTVIKYNQVLFLRTTTAVAPTDLSGNLSGYIDIQADDFYTVYQDTVNSTGFGWFFFYNSTTLKATIPSNAIPYVGFEEGSVKKIFDAFFSLLNNKELRLISNDDAFRWLNEAYTIARNELNMVNADYAVSTEYPINIISGQQEYQMPTGFGNLISVTDGAGDDIEIIKLEDIRRGNTTGFRIKVGYYIRGNFIGFVPLPQTSTVYYIYYNAIAPVLTSYYDNIDLPDDNFYPLVDHMLYRASIKVGRPNPDSYETEFDKGIQRMKVVSVKRDANKDSWGIDLASNI